MTNIFGLTVEKFGPDARSLTPGVDGIPLPALVRDFEIAHGYHVARLGYGGIIPDYFRYGPLRDYFLGAAKGDNWKDGIYLLGCNCGEVGCWPLRAKIAQTGGQICWSDFSQPHRPLQDYAAFGPFAFDRQQYTAVLEEVLANHEFRP